MSSYYYNPHRDLFRHGLIRLVGYAYPIMDMFWYDERDTRDRTYSYIATAGYIGCHTLFHLTCGILDAVDPGMNTCPVLNRLLYAVASGVEAFAWNIFATVIGPYVVCNVVNMFMRTMLITNNEEDGVRGMRHVIRIAAAVSIPVCGWLFVDTVADLIVASLGIKSAIYCPQASATTRTMLL